jgi:hypothetical protein
MKKVYNLSLLLCLLASCKPDLKVSKPSPGTADFSVYLAVGNSLTAGFADNSLYLSGQQNSYPLRLSEQFKLVGGGAFKQPLLMSDIGLYPSPKLILGQSTSCAGITSLGPIPQPTPFNYADTVNISSQGPFNNVGVPGIRVLDYAIPGYANLAAASGAYYAKRFYKDPGGYPIVEALRINATFFTCWLGNNDVLLYATGGGAGADPGVNPGDITAPAFFDAEYNTIIDSLVARGAKGALINIPDVTAIPFFTTVPINALVLRKGQADSLNAAYQGLNGIHFAAGANNFVVQDHSGNIKQIQQGEYILLTVPQDSLTCAGWGSQKPIPSKYVLTSDEVSNVQAATTAYNTTIQNTAMAHKLAYVDMNSYLKTLTSGVYFNGASYNATFVTGGAFSLDGVHLTPHGYALAANHIIEAINATYKSTIPATDANKYSGVKFP